MIQARIFWLQASKTSISYEAMKGKDLEQTGWKSFIVSCFGADPFPLLLVRGRGLGGIFRVGRTLFDDSANAIGVGILASDTEFSGNGCCAWGEP